MNRIRRRIEYWKYLWKTDGEFGFKMDVKLSILIIAGLAVFFVIDHFIRK